MIVDDGSSAPQTAHRALRAVLREGLLVAVASGPGAAGRFESVGCRAAAALYAVLLEHPVDQRGRCLSCRPPGAMAGRRRRRCRIHRTAQYWLYQPGPALMPSMVRELGLILPPPPVARSAAGWPGLLIVGRSGVNGLGAAGCTSRRSIEFPVIALPLLEPAARDGRVIGTVGSGTAAPGDLVPPCPVHHRRPRR